MSYQFQGIVTSHLSHKREMETIRPGSTFCHGQRFSIVLLPEAAAGFICGVYKDDGLVWCKRGMRCIHECLCVWRACSPCYDDLSHVTCTQQHLREDHIRVGTSATSGFIRMMGFSGAKDACAASVSASVSAEPTLPAGMTCCIWPADEYPV